MTTDAMISDLADQVITFLLGGASAGSAIWWGLRNVEKVQRALGFLYRLGNTSLGLFKYRSVGTGIAASVNRVQAAVNSECPGVAPHPVRIKWNKSSTDVEASLRDGQVIVLLEPSPKEEQNLVLATLAYLKKGLLPKARPYIERTLLKATEFTVAKRVFSHQTSSSATVYFFEEHLDPELDRLPDLRRACTTLDRIDDSGFFSRVFLNQLHLLGDRLYPATPSEKHWLEGVQFAGFLERIATRPPGVHIGSGLQYPGTKIRVGMLLVAKPETSIHGTRPYERRLRIYRNLGLEYAYICARNTENILLAKEVAEAQETKGRLSILRKDRYKTTVHGKESPAICIACKLHLTMQAGELPDPASPLVEALELSIPEVRDGTIELVSVAREEGIRSKVAIRSITPGSNAVDICSNPLRIETLKSALGGEDIEFVEWSDDPREVILGALGISDRRGVVDILVDPDNQQALVTTNWWKTRRKALGRNDHNLRLARELTGWEILVEEQPKS